MASLAIKKIYIHLKGQRKIVKEKGGLGKGFFPSSFQLEELSLLFLIYICPYQSHKCQTEKDKYSMLSLIYGI